VALPDSKAIELKVLEKKKQELMSKYATDEFRSQQEEAKSLLNKK
jgi:pre-mRNA-splicing factor ISY1